MTTAKINFCYWPDCTHWYRQRISQSVHPYKLWFLVFIMALHIRGDIVQDRAILTSMFVNTWRRWMWKPPCACGACACVCVCDFCERPADWGPLSRPHPLHSLLLQLLARGTRDEKQGIRGTLRAAAEASAFTYWPFSQFRTHTRLYAAQVVVS